MNTEVPTPRATAAATHLDSPSATEVSAPAASPVATAATAGMTAVIVSGEVLSTDARSPPITTNPGRPGFVGPGAGSHPGRCPTP